MYVSMDRTAGRFVHKHPDFMVICNLTYIEYPNAHFDVAPVDALVNALAHWTGLELSQLYQNTTCEKPTLIGITLRGALQELAERLIVSDVDPQEAEAQAQFCESNQTDRYGYMYVRDAKVPCRRPDLWQQQLRASVPAEELGNAARKHVAYAQQRAVNRAATTATQRAATQASAPKAAARPASRPRSGVCQQIWEVLDAERAKLGELPTRARVKELASQYGWNANTASVQSAAWRKQAVPT